MRMVIKMIIKKLVLNNYGIYYGKNEFNFNVSPDKNLIIIGGKNGSGKTTMLDAIKIALYGALVCGSRTVGKTYSEKIKSKINLKAISEGNPNSYVEIHVNLAQNGKLNEYCIKRSWELIGDNLKEKTIAKKNGKLLTESQVADLEEYFRKFMPKDLFDFFFFDGEKMRDLLDSLMFENILKKEMITLFNLDLFHYLKSDLNRYLIEENTFKNLTNEQETLKKLKNLHDVYQTEYRANESNIGKFLEKLTEINAEIEQLNRDLDNLGKISESERGNIYKKIKTLEIEIKKSQDEIKEFTGEILPFVILKNNVIDLKKSVKKQENFRSYETFINVDQNDLKQQLALNYDNYPIDEIISKINEYYKTKLVENCNAADISPLSVDDTKRIEKIIHRVSNFNKEELREDFKNIASMKEEIKENNLLLRNSDTNEDIKLILRAIASKEYEIKDLETQIEKLSEKNESMTKKLSEVDNEISKIEEKVTQALKDEKKVLMVNNIKNVIDRFTELKNKEKSQKLKENFMEMFSHLMRKEDFITDIEIEMSTLDIKLYDRNGDLIKTELLSEGERQIYVLSLLYSLMKTSGRKIPVVLDSLLGRLDLNHKSNILYKFLPMVSDQAIVLSTDAEINHEDFKMLENYVSNSYVIDFNSAEKRVNIQENYF